METSSIKHNNRNHFRHNNISAWENIVKEVMARKANGQKASILSSDLEKSSFCAKVNQSKSPKTNKPTYILGTEHGDIHITKREVECMKLLLKGKTINNIASMLKIAPRTVMDYINNIKTKIGCNNRHQLIDIVRTNKKFSRFLKTFQMCIYN